MFEPYLRRWALVAEGDFIRTPTARLLPVRWRNAPAMLKLTQAEEERRGAILLEWWGGHGAVRVFARDGAAVLMERATGSTSLSDMARTGCDDEACRILCDTAARLHAPRPGSNPPLTPLAHWFRDLEASAARGGGLLARCAETARGLLAEPREVMPLHGDLHHGNVLYCGSRGWLAIDPKPLVGERGFDFANIFTNPDLTDPSRPVAIDAAHFVRRLAVVAATARVEPRRLLQWILAWTGLSATWLLADDDPRAAVALTVARLAAAELDR